MNGKQKRELRKELWNGTGIAVSYQRDGNYTFCLVETAIGRTILAAFGIAKWNPNDKGVPGYDYDPERGKRIAKARAIRNLAEKMATNA